MENKGLSIAGLFFWGMLLLFLIWLFTGGPERYENKVNPFLIPPETYDSGFEIYGEGGLFQTRVEDRINEGIYLGWTLENKGNFSFLTPPGWTQSSTGKIGQTEFGTISNETITLTYQYGPDANPLNFENRIDHDVAFGKIHGRKTKFVKPKNGILGTTGANIRRNKRKQITVFTNQELSEEQQEEVFQIIGSIKI